MHSVFDYDGLKPDDSNSNGENDGLRPDDSKSNGDYDELKPDESNGGDSGGSTPDGGNGCTNGDTQTPQNGDKLLIEFLDMDKLIGYLGKTEIPNCNWSAMKIKMCDEKQYDTVQLLCFGLHKMMTPIKPKNNDIYPLMLNCNEQVICLYL